MEVIFSSLEKEEEKEEIYEKKITSNKNKIENCIHDRCSARTLILRFGFLFLFFFMLFTLEPFDSSRSLFFSLPCELSESSIKHKNTLQEDCDFDLLNSPLSAFVY